MVELLIVLIISLFFLVLLPRIRKLDDEYTEKYNNKNNKWKENISQHFNGHHQNIGYQDYKYENYNDNEY